MGLYQIHLAGPQRSGKTTLARMLEEALRARGFKPVILDVDHTKLAIFGPNAPIGSPENADRQKCSYNALFGLRIPDVLSAGGTPIMTATHAQDHVYGQAWNVADQHRADLRFILLEPVSVEEVARRARADTGSSSDMRDLETNPDARQTYLETCARFERIYRSGAFKGPHLWVCQGKLEDMFAFALEYVLSESAD